MDTVSSITFVCHRRCARFTRRWRGCFTERRRRTRRRLRRDRPRRTGASGRGVTTVVALFVATNGVYYGLPGVDPWDEERDARLYAGPHPVVAHPPCARWCRLAGLVEARWGHKRGEDGGCFASALNSVRRWGGVLEHPAYSDAWAAFRLPLPPRRRIGWQRGICGG